MQSVNKSISKKFLVLIISLAVLCTGGLSVGLALSGRTVADAFSNSTSSSTYVKVDELWDSEAKAMSGDNVSKLLSYLSSDGTIDGVQASTPQTATDIRGYTYGGKSAEQSVVVRLGGLDWIVTYISTAGDDKIATLWLSNCIQDAFVGRSQTEGEKYGYVTTSVGTGLYSDWSYDWYSSTVGTYPSNMYSTSYIRVVTLNNGGQYATSNSALSSKQSKISSSVFAEFTIDSTSSVGDFDALTDYIVTPNQVSWQTGRQDSKNLISWSYYMNNESTTLGGDYSSTYDYSSKSHYSEWGSDYLWLPSLTEMGYNNTNGLWEVSIEERKNYDGSTTTVSSSVSPGSNNTSSTDTYAYSWSRSANYSNSLNASLVNPSGASYNNYFVSNARAVRPALHLNLTSAALSAATVPTEFTGTDRNGNPVTYYVTIDGTSVQIDSVVMTGTSALAVPAFFTDSGKTYYVVSMADGCSNTGVFYPSREYLTGITLSSGITNIGAHAFDSCKLLTSVSIPSTVQTIGDYAFFGCDLITGTLGLQSGVTSIGDYAFADCIGLNSVIIPGTVVSIGICAFNNVGVNTFNIPAATTSIGARAFGACDALTSITVESTNPNYSAQNGILYNKNQTILICCPAGVSSATIASTTNTIDAYAFAYCDRLTAINIPASVTSIGNYAFYATNSLLNVYIAGNITSTSGFGVGAFRGNNSAVTYWFDVESTYTTAQSAYAADGTKFTSSNFKIEQVVNVIDGQFGQIIDQYIVGRGEQFTLDTAGSTDSRFVFLSWYDNDANTTLTNNSQVSFTVTKDMSIEAIYQFAFDNFAIDHSASLYWLSDCVNNGYTFDNVIFTVTCDLDLTSVSDNTWQTIGDATHDFAGVVQGNGYVVSGNTGVTLFYSGLSGTVTDLYTIGVSLGIDATNNLGDLCDPDEDVEIVWEDNVIAKPR